MSKFIRPNFPVFGAILLILSLADLSAAQSVEAHVTIEDAARRARVAGRFVSDGDLSGKRNFFFLASAPGQPLLGERISDVRLFGRDGSPIEFKRFAAGEYLALADFSSWSFSVSFAGSVVSPHSSWSAADAGMLMLDDLLPKLGGVQLKAGSIELELPTNWRVATTESASGVGFYSVADVEKAVFHIGSGLRTSTFAVNGDSVQVATDAKWHFTDDEAAAMAVEIFKDYRKVYGPMTMPKALIALVRLPAASPGNWQAETRGRTVTIVSSDMNFRTQSLQRLHEQFRHELFHLWIPNSLNLTGNYDWFYEGFALYKSLKNAVMLNRIRFEDLLDTLSRAYAIDSRQTARLSLIDASKSRSLGNDTRIYARGILVAILVDISLLERSKGKHSIDDILQGLLSRHGPGMPSAEANPTVLTAMRDAGVDAAIIEKYVLGTGPVDWERALAAAGLEAGPRGLTVMAKPTSRQKVLLNKLGYNNWRKLSAK